MNYKHTNITVFIVFLVFTCSSVDGFGQTMDTVQWLIPNGGSLDNNFGYSVAADGDYAIVGAPYNNTDANESNPKSNAGAAYIFKKNSLGNWHQMQKLVANDRTSDDRFGVSVVIQGQYAIVGASKNKSDQAGQNFLSNAGAAYVFKRNPQGIWQQVQKLTASVRHKHSMFGYSMDMDQNTLVIGAYCEAYNENEQSAKGEAGGLYVFDKDTNGIWTFSQKLVASDRAAGSRFGVDVAIHGNTIITGAYYASITLGNLYTERSGAAYVYQKNSNSSWQQTQKLIPSNRAKHDYFGFSVDVYANKILIGAYNAGPKSYTQPKGHGAAYLFQQDSGAVWSEIDILVDSVAQLESFFGYRVQLNEFFAVISAPSKNSGSIKNAGEVLVYMHNPIQSSNSLIHTFKNPQSQPDAYFGKSLFLLPNEILIGMSEIGPPSSTSINNQYTEAVGIYHLRDSVVIISHEVCGSFNSVNGIFYKRSGTYYEESVLNDNTIHHVLDLTIHPEDTTFVKINSCGNFTSNSGITYQQSGVYTEVSNTAFGCDSTTVLNISIATPQFTQTSKKACGHYTSPNGQTYTQSGNYTEVLTSKHGCDSTVQLNLTILKPQFNTIKSTTCGSYTSDAGNTYYQSGTYTELFTAHNGCDSIVTLNLEINQIKHRTINAEACGSYLGLDGKVYNISGQYRFVKSTSKGCDSIITLDLTIHPNQNTTKQFASCDPIQYNGQNYSTTGTYYQYLTSSAGCDSIVQIDYVRYPASDTTIAVSSCQYYSLNGFTYSKCGHYKQFLINRFGCDSTLHLDISILTTTSTIYVKSCPPYESPNGIEYSQSGTYSAILTNAAGCDSIITINLEIVESYYTIAHYGNTLQIMPNPDATFQWLDVEKDYAPIHFATEAVFIPVRSGTYAVEVREFGCTSISEPYSVSISEPTPDAVNTTTTSFSVEEDAPFSIFPNPATHIVQINFGQPEQAANLQLYNNQGQLIYTQGNLQGQATQLDVSQYPTGLYFLQLELNDQVIREKLLIP